MECMNAIDSSFQHYPSVGEKNEDICCQIMNTGIIAAMKEMYDY